MLQSLKNSLWKMEILIWKSKNKHPTWHGAIAITLSMIVATLAGYAIIVYVAPWFGISINWDDTNTNYETLFILVSYVVGAVFFTLIISFLNAERIGKVIKEVQKDKTLQSEKFEMIDALCTSLLQYPGFKLLGFDIIVIETLRRVTRVLVNLEIVRPDIYVSYQDFKDKTASDSDEVYETIAGFEKIVNVIKEKVQCLNKAVLAQIINLKKKV